jgi:hypothetical protein
MGRCFFTAELSALVAVVFASTGRPQAPQAPQARATPAPAYRGLGFFYWNASPDSCRARPCEFSRGSGLGRQVGKSRSRP